MQLTVSKRTPGKKTEIKKIRREGNIPAIFYSQGKAGEEIVVNGIEFNGLVKQVKPGCLSTTVFSLKIGGKEIKALLKDIQYEITTYNVIHLDFIELVENVPVNLNVPLQFTGTVDCIGVKPGGILRPVIRTVKVSCLPKDIPTEFELDVRDLGIRQSRRLSDIKMPPEVRPLSSLSEVAVVVAKR